MAESRGSLIAKSVQKHAGRAKEKLLQNLGKVDKTADEIFDEHLQNFTRQQAGANRLQKEFANYIRCVRAAQAASKTLLEAIGDIYESQWTGHDLLYVQCQNVDMLWQDFSHKLADQVLLPLNTYQAQFPEMRKKIDKRGRKLVDYDGQRHSFQALQTNMKKRDEAKISKGREQLEEAKRTYDILNSELHDELPALYDSRVLFLVTNLQSLFNAENVFHSEAAKIYEDLEGIVDKLATDSQRGSYSVRKSNGPSLPSAPPTYNNSQLIINNVSPVKKTLDEPQSPTKTVPDAIPLDKESSNSVNSINSINSNGNTPSPPVSPVKIESNDLNDGKAQQKPEPKPEMNGNAETVTAKEPSPTPITNNTQKNEKNEKQEELYDIPQGASTENLPPGVLYRVKATYKYNREDEDELSFEVGELIQVVEYEDPEEQEEGWLMGIKETSGEKGMFPANFTRPI